MRNKFKISISVISALLLMAWAAPVKGADTSDVVGALILGGIIGSQIEKNNDAIKQPEIILPDGTRIIIPSYYNLRQRDMDSLCKYTGSYCPGSRLERELRDLIRRNEYNYMNRGVTPHRYDFLCGNRYHVEGCLRLLGYIR
tara:strand:+ start:2582 stop:3007 length:426 start_codon:yes stop_codon:yes gene_type:complete